MFGNYGYELIVVVDWSCGIYDDPLREAQAGRAHSTAAHVWRASLKLRVLHLGLVVSK